MAEHDFTAEANGYDSGLGDAIAADLRRGDALMFHKVQGLVATAQQTGNWYYGDLIMRIIWGMLPDDARSMIAKDDVPEWPDKNI